MADQIPLIQTDDGFEMVRNAIANIIAIESVDQQSQATAAELDPSEWALDVYVERSNPWESFRGGNGATTPIINVWYETSGIDKRSSNAVNQTNDSIINVDCYGFGVSEETAEGHESGDEVGTLDAQRAARLVRKIVMHPKWKLLGLGRSVVGQRWLTNRQSFKPVSGDGPVERVMAVNLQFTVTHSETIDLEALSDAEGALVTIKREPDGQVIAQMDFDWT